MALVAALGGTAVGAKVLNKKQVKKIAKNQANDVFNQRAGGLTRVQATLTLPAVRHTFGTRMAASGVPLRTLQEWMGHRDFKTTLICADYAPSAHESEMVEAAFRGPIRGPKQCATERNTAQPSVAEDA